MWTELVVIATITALVVKVLMPILGPWGILGLCIVWVACGR